MDDLRDDIVKYQRGELSPAEMHALEKRALDDPFLADALEGVSRIAPEELAADLRMLEHALKEKQTSRKTIPVRTWVARIAAGLAVVGLATFLIVKLTPTSTEKIAVNNTPKVSEAPIPPQVLRDSIPVEEKPSVAGPQDEDMPPSSGTSTRRAKPSIGQPIQDEQISGAGNLNGLIAEEKLSKERIASADGEAAVAPVSVSAPPQEIVMQKLENSVAAHDQLITGTVIDAEDGRALPGVNVVIEGGTTGTVTDEMGQFILPADSLGSGLLFSFIGYEDQVIKPNTLKGVSVVMKPDASQLSEVVVVGYGGIKRDDPDTDPIVEAAEPAGGRKAFKEYLERNLKYPDQALNNKIEGKVTVQFTVDPNGRTSDFKVLKGLGYGCDEEVIRLIQQGPRWRPGRKNTEAVSDRVRVRMKFSLPKK